VRRAILDAGRLGADALARALLDRASVSPHESPSAARRKRTEGGDVALRFAGASFRYEEAAAVQDLELDLREGECVGIAGPNGAGKSTLLALAAGVHEPQAGAVERLAGPGRQRAFLLFQMPERLFFAETVAEELAFGLERLGLDREERERRSRGALARVGLPPDAFLPRAPLSLSAGEMRRVAFAIMISLDAELVLLDEPTSCLDSAGRELLAGIIAEQTSRGHAVMIASHDVGFLVRVCDRIAWVRRGRLDAMVTVEGGDLPSEQTWPGDPLAVLGLQDHLAALGAPVVPRALTEERLLERL
jgi:energy-coupling factor transporter ATP-binding protein EcfA2